MSKKYITFSSCNREHVINYYKSDVISEVKRTVLYDNTEFKYLYESVWDGNAYNENDILLLNYTSVVQALCELSDEEINYFFSYIFTGGKGYQEGDPENEWHTITISELPSDDSDVYKSFELYTIN
uniref:Uncharacterized protein n=1 Tax=viral metagenome TaxID=1070528 RepID=A0A6C0J598_9ZZZZ